MKKIGVVGSRRRDLASDMFLVEEVVKDFYEEGDVIVSGGCQRGADHFAELVARDLGCTIIIHHANWKDYGKSAGHIRNQKIAEDSDILIAMVSPDRTGGTESTIKKYLALGKTELVLI